MLQSRNIGMKHGFSVKTCFDILTQPLGSRVCVRKEYVLAWCYMLYASFPFRVFISATVANGFIAPYSALWNVHQRRTVIARLATVLGPLIEALKGEIYLVELTIGNL